MPDQTFKPGDVVCLKSGGPKMTVHYCRKSSTDDVECGVVWHSEDGVMRTEVVLAAILQPAKQTQTPAVELRLACAMAQASMRKRAADLVWHQQGERTGLYDAIMGLGIE